MNKKILILATCVLSVLLFSGCSTKARVCKAAINGYPTSFSGNGYAVQGVAGMSISSGHNVKVRNMHALQNAAQFTLDRGYKYFAIMEPAGEANNEHGSTINTAAEFMERCTKSSLNWMHAGGETCGIPNNPKKITLGIYVFNEQPLEMLTYDAKQTLEDIKALGYYKDEGYVDYHDRCTTEYLSFGDK